MFGKKQVSNAPHEGQQGFQRITTGAYNIPTANEVKPAAPATEFQDVTPTRSNYTKLSEIARQLKEAASTAADMPAGSLSELAHQKTADANFLAERARHAPKPQTQPVRNNNDNNGGFNNTNRCPMCGGKHANPEDCPFVEYKNAKTPPKGYKSFAKPSSNVTSLMERYGKNNTKP